MEDFKKNVFIFSIAMLIAILMHSCEKDKSLQCETERVDYTLNQNGVISHGYDLVTTCTDFEGNTFEL